MWGKVEFPRAGSSTRTLVLENLASFPRMRVLAWARDTLYASRGYEVFSISPQKSLEWHAVARFAPSAQRNVSARVPLASRLFRDGFHALCVLSSGQMVGAVPGAIVTCTPGQRKFTVTHEIHRGTRPLHITATPSGLVYWGEYFDNAERGEVHIYCSDDQGMTWQVAYTFPARTIRHLHNIIFDRWQNCLWILTGDNGHECKIMRASVDLKTVEPVLEGDQQARAVALIPTPAALYFASDTPLEANSIYRFERCGKPAPVTPLNHSSIFGCAVGSALFFSTMVEPSVVNTSREVRLYGSGDGSTWQNCCAWKKDPWPMSYFQYGNCFLPDGDNTTNFLAASTIAVENGDELMLWRVDFDV